MGEAVAGFWILDLGLAVTFLCLWKLWIVLRKRPIPFMDRIRSWLSRHGNG